MLTGFVIEAYDDLPIKCSCGRLIQEAKGLNIELRSVGVYNTVVGPQGVVNAGKPLHVFDFALHRYEPGTVRNIIARRARHVYPATGVFDRFVDKYEQCKRAWSTDVITPRFCTGTATMPFDSVAQMVGLPFVAKGLMSKHGREVFIVHGDSEFHNLAQRFDKSKQWLFQEFIGSSYGKVLKVFCLRGEAVAAMISEIEAAYPKLPRCYPAVLDTKLQKIASDIYAHTRLDFVEIDVLFGRHGEYYFCDLDVSPDFVGMEQCCEVNIAQRILRSIKSDFE